MPYTIQKYGWLPDLPDARDHRYAAPMAVLSKLPASVDLRPKCPPVYDQGQLGSCTGNAIAGAIQFGRRKAKQKPDFVPSRLFIYYMIGTTSVFATTGPTIGTTPFWVHWPLLMETRRPAISVYHFTVLCAASGFELISRYQE